MTPNLASALFSFFVAGLLVYGIAQGNTSTFVVVMLYVNVVLGILNLHIDAVNRLARRE